MKKVKKPNVLLIDNYDSFTYNLYQYLEELGATTTVIRNNEISVEEIERKNFSHIIISPGPGDPDSAGVTLETIQYFTGKLPVLGVCLGHQAIGQVFGGKVVRAPKMMHGKISKIKHDGKGVFQGVAKNFSATRYHSLMVKKEKLPKILEVTARSPDGVIMGLRHREFAVEGVQFHPESIMTGEGKKILKNFLKMSEMRSA